MKKILLISDITWGGAAVAAGRLRYGLQAHADLQVEWIAGRANCRQDVVDAYDCAHLSALLIGKLLRKLRLPSRFLDKWNRNLLENSVIKYVHKYKPDIINLHNIHQNMSFDLVRKIPNKIPIIWTLHDMWPLTGYCCYSFDCEKYASSCIGDCPQENMWGSAEMSAEQEWLRRQRIYQNSRKRLVFVANSRWTQNCVKKRFKDVIRVQHIPISLNTKIFWPLEKAAARQALGLTEKKYMVLMGCQSIDDQRKGMKLGLDALKMLERKIGPVFDVVVFGGNNNPDLPGHWKLMGQVYDERFLNILFSAADVFVAPSLAESFGQVCLEAAAAGTPSVSFAVGGLVDIVRNDLTGFLATTGDVNDLAFCIERVFKMSDSEYSALSASCRNIAVEEYSLDLQAKRYAALFQEIVRS